MHASRIYFRLADWLLLIILAVAFLN